MINASIVHEYASVFQEAALWSSEGTNAALNEVSSSCIVLLQVFQLTVPAIDCIKRGLRRRTWK